MLVTAFLKNGWSVIATMRNSQLRREVFREELQKYDKNLKILNFDVTSETDLEKVCSYIETNENSELDCLINNAGYGVFSALEDASPNQIREQIDINVTGLILTTRALLPFLRKTRGHIINFSSVLGYSALPLTSLYCGSKYAVEGFSESLYYELLTHQVRVSIVEPGSFATDFKAKVIYGEKSSSEDSPYFKQSQNYKAYTSDFSAGADPKHVVAAVLKAALSTNPPLRIRCGVDANSVYLAKSLAPAPLFRFLSRFFFGMTINKN